MKKIKNIFSSLTTIILISLSFVVFSEFTTFTNVASAVSEYCVSSPAGMVSWWPGDGNANDIWDANPGTLMNGALANATGKVGQAFTLDGVDDYVNVPDSTNLDITDAITIDAWINPRALGMWDKVAIKADGDVLSNYAYTLGLSSKGGVYFGLFKGTSQTYINGGATVIPTNTWTHIAGTWNGTTMKIYVNGVEQPETASFVGSINSVAAPLKIGICPYQGTPYAFDGLIDEVEIYNRALSASEIQAIYNAGSAGKCKEVVPTCVTPPSDMVSWWPGDGNANDIWDVNPGTLMNGTTFAAGKVGQAFTLDGVNDYVNVPDAPSLDFANKITIEGWVYPTSRKPSGTTGYLVDKANNYFLIADYSPYNNTVVGGIYPGLILDSGVTLPLNQWSHIALTFDNSVSINNTKIYINGVEVKSDTYTGQISTNNYPLRIGCASVPWAGNCASTWAFAGKIDEVEIYNRALSASEIQAIYNAGSAGKCKVACLSEMVSYWKGEGNAQDSIDANPGTLMNGATFATGKVGQAFSLDGINDYIEMGIPGSNLNFIDNAVTLETWIYPDATTGTFRYIAHKENHYGLLLGPDGKVRLYLSPIWAVVESNAILIPGKWYHIVGTFSVAEGLAKLYIDGQLDKQISKTAALGTMNTPMRIGGWPGQTAYFDGLIDEVAAYNRSLSASEIQQHYQNGLGGKDYCGISTMPADTTPPSTTATYTDTQVNAPWYISDVTATLTAIDDDSGVKTTYYCVDQTDTCTPDQIYASPFIITTESANNYVRYYSVDNSDNIEQIHSDTIKIDKTSPTTTSNITGTQEDSPYADWYKDMASVTLAASDAVSGVDKIYYCIGQDCSPSTEYASLFNVATQGTNYVRFYSQDLAGNNEQTQQIIIKIDKDSDGDGLYDNFDVCSTIFGPPERQGCPYGDLNIVELHLIDQAKKGVCPNSASSCKSPLANAVIRVFDRNNAQFQSMWTKNPSGTLYANVFDQDVGRIATCTTGSDGKCTAGENYTGDFLVIVKYYDAATGKTVYTGKPKSPSDFINGLATKNFQIIKIYKKDGTVQFNDNSKTVVAITKNNENSPKKVVLSAGQSLWSVVQNNLTAKASPADIAKATKIVAKDNGINIPEWNIDEGKIDARRLPAGFLVNLAALLEFLKR